MNFSIYHVGKNKWAVKNACGEWWCGKYEWVNETSSFWNFTPDCMNKSFDWEDLYSFVDGHFDVKLGDK